MRRGEIWTASGGKDYSGKPRPVVIIQDDAFNETKSITVCSFTTNETVAPAFRLAVAPDELNGLRLASRLMVDKITAMPRSKLGDRIGRLDDTDMLRLNQALVVFLGLAISPHS
jgi:mRNA interferase MazF